GTSYTSRGNMTAITKWTDLSGGGASNTSNNKYDKFGNLLKAQVSCCNQKTFVYTQNTYWSQPEQLITGDTAGLNLTEYASYNFNNGTVANETSPNNQTTLISYDGFGRPTNITLPTGASGVLGYNIWGSTSSSSLTFSDGGVNKTVTQSVVFDGW